MEKWVLVIGGNSETIGDIRHGFADQDEFIHAVSNASEAVRVLTSENSYLLIVVFRYSSDSLLSLRNIRSLTNIPILVLVERHNGDEKIAVTEAGADEYLPWPETSREVLASCRALIRRYMIFGKKAGNSLYS